MNTPVYRSTGHRSSWRSNGVKDRSSLGGAFKRDPVWKLILHGFPGALLTGGVFGIGVAVFCLLAAPASRDRAFIPSGPNPSVSAVPVSIPSAGETK